MLCKELIAIYLNLISLTSIVHDFKTLIFLILYSLLWQLLILFLIGCKQSNSIGKKLGKFANKCFVVSFTNLERRGNY